MKIMVLLLSLWSFFFLNSPKQQPSEIMINKKLTYLALGDSYTIGEGLKASNRYPNQLVQKLRKSSSDDWQKPKIIAKTGWTVDELAEGINQAAIEGQTFDLVTLSIGVNNQYRNRPVEEYKIEFEALLNRAIAFASNKTTHVVVLSIPDWGVTPFASSEGVDRVQIAREIDLYNEAKKEVCDAYQIQFIDITLDYRKIGGESKMVVSDNLHPSKTVQRQWAEKLFNHISAIKF